MTMRLMEVMNRGCGDDMCKEWRVSLGGSEKWLDDTGREEEGEKDPKKR